VETLLKLNLSFEKNQLEKRMVIEAIEKSQKGQGLKMGQFQEKMYRYDWYGMIHTEKSVFKPPISHW